MRSKLKKISRCLNSNVYDSTSGKKAHACKIPSATQVLKIVRSIEPSAEKFSEQIKIKKEILGKIVLNPDMKQFAFYTLQIFEDVHLHEKPKLVKALEILNYIFAAIFTLEFVLKAIGFGLVKYFSSAWNCLDAFIVSVSKTLRVASSSRVALIRIKRGRFFFLLRVR